jgi:hypothetical protein
MRRIFTCTLAFFLAIFSVGAIAQATSMTTDANLAGEQRMLVQRVAKLYSQVGLNVMPSVAVSQLGLASRRFENNLLVLQPVAAKSEELGLAYTQLIGEWQRMKRALSQDISRENAEALARQAEVTLAVAEKLTRLLETSNTSGHVVNLAGRQRMLSQRIANNYLLRSWGVESSAVVETLAVSVSDFSAGLAKLRERKGNSAELQRELEEVTQQWEWLQAALSVEGAGAYRLIVTESADAILEATDRITRLYEVQGQH